MKRITAMMLTLVMVFNMLPLQAFAQETPQGEETLPTVEETVPAPEGVQGEESAPETVQMKTDTFTVNIPVSQNLADNFTLLQGLVRNGGARTISTAGFDGLGTMEQKFYDFLATNIRNVALYGGSTVFANTEFTTYGLKTAWTNSDLGVASIDDARIGSALERFSAQFDYYAVVDALLHDLPLHCYWLDKVTGVQMQLGVSLYGYNDGQGNDIITEVVVDGLEFYCAVSTVYSQDGDKYAVSDELYVDYSQTAATAFNWMSVAVNNYSTDYDRLLAFKDKICLATHYNHNAAENGVFSEDANPWQVIEVLWGTDADGVVCEGYAKTFQLLCDTLADYDTNSDFECYTVTGVMTGGTGSGRHMWNIVTMDDGRNYIVDVTNCDTGSVGQNGELFLATATGSVAGGYTVNINGDNVTYVYDSDMVSLLGEGRLEISEYAYGETEPSAVTSGTIAGSLGWNYADGTLYLTGMGDVPVYTAQNPAPWAHLADSITNLNISHGVLTLYTSIFDDLTQLSTVYYTGAPSWWADLEGTSARDFTSIIRYGVADIVVQQPENGTVSTSVADAYPGDNITVTATPATGYQLKEILVNGTAITGNTFAASFDDTTGIITVTAVFEKAKVLVESGDCGDSATWALYDTDGDSVGDLLNIGGSGRMADYSYNGAPWYDYRSDITEIDIADGITYIGKNAFYLTKAVKVTVPASVKSVGSSAFSSSKVGAVYTPSLSAWLDIEFAGDSSAPTYGGAQLYVGGQLVTDLVIPEGITEIKPYAFYKITALTSVTVPSTLETVGVAAFSDCTGLTAVYAPSLEDWMEISFNAYTSNPLYKAKYLYINGQQLTELVIPETITAIGNSTFAGLKGVTSVTLHDGVTSMGKYAFDSASGMNAVHIESVESWINIDFEDGYASPLTYAKNLYLNGQPVTDVVYPAGSTEVKPYTFRNCETIESVTLPDSVTKIGKNAFANATNLETVQFPALLKKIDTYAFQYCTALTSVDVAAEVISDYAFKNCKGLKQLNLGEGTDRIGFYVFDSCSNLEKVTIGSTVTYIDNTAFGYCSKLAEVHFKGDAPYIANNAFTSVTATVYYPIRADDWTVDKLINYYGTLTWVPAGEGETVASGTCGTDLDWLLDETGNLIITGTGDMNTYSYSSGVTTAPWKTYYSQIKTVTIDKGVTSISNYAFYGCSGIKNIVFKGDMPTISSYAFRTLNATATYNADNATWVPGTLGSYGGTITWKVKGYSEEYLGKGSGWDISYDGVLTIKENTGDFASSSSAPWYKYRNHIKKVVSAGAKHIGNFSFYGYTQLTDFDTASKISSIGNYAFYGCTNLKNVNFGDYTYYVGDHAFYNCTSLQKVFLSPGNGYSTALSSYAFAGCTNLTEVSFSATAPGMGSSVFSGCTKLKTIYINNFGTLSGASLASDAFAGLTGTTIYYPAGTCSYTSNMKAYGGDVTWVESYHGTLNSDVYWTLDVDTGVLDIRGSGEISRAYRAGMDMPWGNLRSSIKSVYIGEGITCLPQYVFENCKNLTSISLPQTLKVLWLNAVQGCTSLNNIVLPSSLEEFGDSRYYFNGNSILTDMYFFGTEEEWNRIPGASGVYNNSKTMTKHFLVETSTDPTCTQPGTKPHYRYDDTSVYDEYYDLNKNLISAPVAAPATGHNYSAVVTEPDCENGGYTTYTCDRCQDSYIADETVKLGHSFTVYTFNNDSTCLEDGTETATCDRCNETDTRAAENSSLGHNYEPTVYPPSCTETGYTHHICQRCGDNYTDSETPLAPHDVDQYTYHDDGTKTGWCNTCQQDVTVSCVIDSGICGDGAEWILYDMDDDGIGEKLSVTGTGAMEDYSSADDAPWAEYAQGITEIEIGEGITYIGQNSFAGCINATVIIIGGKDTSIGDGAFPAETDPVFTLPAGGVAESQLKEMGYTNLDLLVMAQAIAIADFTMAVADTVVLPQVTITPDNATLQPVYEWQSSDETVVKIVDGRLCAVTVGTAQLTVTETTTGLTSTATVSVTLAQGDSLFVETDTAFHPMGFENGETRTLVVSSQQLGVIPAHKLIFTSSDPSAVQVDENGVITSVYTGAGTARTTVTATLASDSSVTAEILVKAIAKQSHLLTIIPQIPADYADEITVIYDEDTLIPALIIPCQLVKNGTLPLTLTAQAQDAEGNIVPASVKWTTSNKKVSSATAVKGKTDTATATVAKNVDGIAIITATTTDLAKTTAQLEIDVRDYTPRLETSSITVNSNLTTGYEIPLYTAYDALLKNYTPAQLMSLEEDTRVIGVHLAGHDSIRAEYDSEKSVISVFTDRVIKNGTYTLTLHINTAKGVTQQTLKVKVANKLPKITVKQPSTFNLFYKDSAVDLSVTAASAQVTQVNLLDTATFAATAYDSLTSAITLTYADTANPVGTFTAGKPDTKATLEITLEDYKNPVTKTVTIKAKETAPKLSLSRTSTTYTWMNSQYAPFAVIHTVDKNTKVNLDFTQYTVSADASAGFVTLSADGTDVYLSTLLNSANTFVDGRTTHTVNLHIGHANWIKTVALNHKITVNKTPPTVKVSQTAVSLSTVYGGNGDIMFTPSLANCPVPQRFEVTALAPSAETEKFLFVQDGWQVNIRFKDNLDMPAAGSYKFTVAPVVLAGDGTSTTLKAVTITVTVTDKLPALKAKTATATLNATLGNDTVVLPLTPGVKDCPTPVRYTVELVKEPQAGHGAKLAVQASEFGITAAFADMNDLPANGSYQYRITPYIADILGDEKALSAITVTVKVNTTQPKVTLAKTSVKLNRLAGEEITVPLKVTQGYVITDAVVTYGAGNTLSPDQLSVVYDKVTQSLKVEVHSTTIADQAYKFSITPYVKLAGDDITTEKMLNTAAFTVTVTGKTATLTAKASGSIDLVNRAKGITYTITGGSNLNFDATKLLTDSFDLTGPDADKFQLQYIGTNAKGQPQLMVTALEGAGLSTKVSYKLVITARVQGLDTTVSTATLSVKPKQTSLKFITAGNTTVYHSYTGAKVLNISVKSPVGAQIDDLQLLNTKRTTVPAGALKVYTTQNPDGTWKISYTVARESLLTVGKTYKLAFAVTPYGNATDKAPQTLTVSLKVKR